MNVQILDCTLRDGGRVNGCKFQGGFVNRLIYSLTEAKVDIIEIGFLRGESSTQSSSIRFFFTDVGAIAPYLPEERSSTYVVFVDFGLYDFDTLTPFDGSSVDGIRLAFTKKDFDTSRAEIVRCAKIIKDNGYKLFLQGVNTLSYTDRQLLDVIDLVNEIEPLAFGIVDTFGSMYIDDVQRYYQLINNNLDPNVIIDFHSHNNYQLSFSFAQEVIKLSGGKRNIIIDATLRGMGKGAGNLNTELLADFLVRKMGYSYNLDKIMDIIDLDITDLWAAYDWGYNPAYFMAGIFQTNPNNIIYLLDKYRLDTNDVKTVLASLTAEERGANAFEKIDEAYARHRFKAFDDSAGIRVLAGAVKGRPVLVLCPGKTLTTHRREIDEYVKAVKPVIFSVSFISDYDSLAFFANKKRYYAFCYEGKTPVIVTSDIARGTEVETVLSAERLKDRLTYGSGALALLYYLAEVGADDIAIAGMDGFSVEHDENYFDTAMTVLRTSGFVQQKNSDQQAALTAFMEATASSVKLLTPSIFKLSGSQGDSVK